MPRILRSREVGDGVVGFLLEQQVTEQSRGRAGRRASRLPRRAARARPRWPARRAGALNRKSKPVGRARAFAPQFRIMRARPPSDSPPTRLSFHAGTDQVAVRWNTVSSLACCAMIGIDWIADEPVPITPTRELVKSTPLLRPFTGVVDPILKLPPCRRRPDSSAPAGSRPP